MRCAVDNHNYMCRICAKVFLEYQFFTKIAPYFTYSQNSSFWKYDWKDIAQRLHHVNFMAGTCKEPTCSFLVVVSPECTWHTSFLRHKSFLRVILYTMEYNNINKETITLEYCNKRCIFHQTNMFSMFNLCEWRKQHRLPDKRPFLTYVTGHDIITYRRIFTRLSIRGILSKCKKNCVKKMNAKLSFSHQTGAVHPMFR